MKEVGDSLWHLVVDWVMIFVLLCHYEGFETKR